jgi:hypothetical protein
VCALILGAGDPLIYTADSADHIAYIRTIARTHEAFPERFYYAESGLLTRDIRKGMAHALWGALTALSGGHDAMAIWPYVSLIGSTFLLVAVYAAGIMLFGSAWIGLLAVTLMVLFHDGGFAKRSLTAMGGGYLFGRSLYIAALAFGLSWLATGRRSLLALAAAASLAAACTHVAHLAVMLFMLGVCSVSVLARRGAPVPRAVSIRRVAALAALVLAISAPYVTMRYLRDYAPNNALHTHVQGVLYFTESLYIMNPIVFGGAAGPLGLLSLLSLAMLRRRVRDHEHFRILVLGVAAVYLLLFVPLWFPFLLRKLSYLLIRFEFAAPSMLMAAFLLGELWRALTGRAADGGKSSAPPLGRAAAFVSLTVVVAILGVSLLRASGRIAYTKRAAAAYAPSSFRNLDDLFAFIEENVPPGGVVAADPITSYGIPAFTDRYAMVPFDQHATPNDSTAIRRIVDARRLLSPWTAPDEIASILDSYGACCLVVNGRIPPRIETLYWKPVKSSADSVAAALRRCGAFTERFNRESVSLFSYEVGRIDACAGAAAAPFIGGAVDSLAASAMPDARQSGVRVARVALSRARVARGDTVSAFVTWVAPKSCPFSSYVAHLRFDTGFPQGVLYSAAWGKPYRKLLERVSRERYRFRVDFQPLGGLFPPDEWPPLREIRDQITFSIPRDAAPGIYTMFLRMAERPQYPNYALSDILTDDDFYRGAAVGRIEIE